MAPGEEDALGPIGPGGSARGKGHRGVAILPMSAGTSLPALAVPSDGCPHSPPAESEVAGGSRLQIAASACRGWPAKASRLTGIVLCSTRKSLDPDSWPSQLAVLGNPHVVCAWWAVASTHGISMSFSCSWKRHRTADKAPAFGALPVAFVAA